MPQYLAPGSHANRIIFLTRSAATGQVDIDAGRNYVTQTTVDAINALLPNYGTAVNAIPVASAGRTKEIRERNEAVSVVSNFTRDLWEVLKRRVNRNGEPAEVLQFYGLPLDGIVPKPTTSDEWLSSATKCVNGDAAAVVAGHAAMANPSATEVAAVLATANTEASEVAAADRTHDEALETADTFIPQADLLIEDIMAELRFNTRRMDYPSQRRVQRTYGARFRALPGEPSEGDQNETIGTGDAANIKFTGTLTHLPIEPGSVIATDGIEVLVDTDNGAGTGTLAGSAGGNGTINYTSGGVSVNFNAAPAEGANVDVAYFGGV
jgi:hypothetical protein